MGIFWDCGGRGENWEKYVQIREFFGFFGMKRFTRHSLYLSILFMNKAVLCDKVQSALGDNVTKAAAENVVKVVLDAIADGIRKEETVQLIGFGTFKVSHRAARMGRNPKTGETMPIPASKSVKFSPSASFKKSL